MQMGDQAIGKRNYIKSSWQSFPTKECLASHCHEGFTIARGKYLVKGEKIRKGMEGRNDSHCLLFILLAFAFYEKLHSVGISMCLFLLSSSFIGAD